MSARTHRLYREARDAESAYWGALRARYGHRASEHHWSPDTLPAALDTLRRRVRIATGAYLMACREEREVSS